MRALLLALVAGASLPAQDAPAFFAENCVSCHTIGGGRLAGPDLKDVHTRRDRGWLAQFIVNPKAAIDRGDPYALQLQQEARGVVMPSIAGMTPALAGRLLDLIAAESKLTRSRFAGAQISDRPFTGRDVDLGRRLFSGNARFASGAAPCISCHSMPGLAGLGGGGLAPDLTKVYERLGGRKGLGSWLSAPATPTMQALFRKNPVAAEEILPLLAAFETAARTPERPDTVARTVFLLLGIAGASAGLVVFDAAWKRRFRSVRRAMVDAARTRPGWGN
jgi:mono/diheme cytochrome c family protein